MSVIYLDNNATTSVAPEVFESMIPFFTEKYGNASSMHTFGGQVGKSIQDAREKVAAMLGAQPEEIVFTSCGTESDSTAVMSALQAQPEKKHVITTRVEHSALIALGQHLEQKGRGFKRAPGSGRTVGRYAQRYGHCLHHVRQQ